MGGRVVGARFWRRADGRFYDREVGLVEILGWPVAHEWLEI